MMEGVRQWLLGVTLTAFAGGLARQLAPAGREQGMVRLVGGLLLVLALLSPLGSWEWEGLALPAFQEAGGSGGGGGLPAAAGGGPFRDHSGKDRRIYMGQSGRAGPVVHGGGDNGGGGERDPPAGHGDHHRGL